jgi:hypothetical protein
MNHGVITKKIKNEYRKSLNLWTSPFEVKNTIAGQSKTNAAFVA